MLTLAFDTSGAHCAAAVLRGDTVLAERAEAMEKGQAERLIPLLEDVLTTAGLGWPDITLIAVGTGPGNFTGVRIAVAAARGLALGLGIPAIGVTRLEALAHGLPRPLVVIEDARRAQVYVQVFADVPHPACLMAVDALASLGALAATGSAAAQGAGPVLPPAQPLAVAIGQIAAQRAHRAQPRPAPFYLRGPDAALPSDPMPVLLDAGP